MTTSILGTGWLGSALFKELVSNSNHKHCFYGSSRKLAKREELTRFIREQQLLADSDNDVLTAVQSSPKKARHKMFSISVPDFQEADAAFFRTDVLVITIPPGRRREDVAERYPEEISAIIEQAIQQGVKHIIYTSSTGVYGAAQGIVDEQTPPAPITNSAKAVLAAEAKLSACSIPVTILRLAGLYGPERHPGRWFSGKEELPNADAAVNLVHQSDVVNAIKKVVAIGPPKKGTAIFNVCSSAHPTKRDFYTTAIQQYGGVLPKMVAGGENGKRISSEKLRTLGWSSKVELV